jgi:hypothetical protein
MSLVRDPNFFISLDGFGTGEQYSPTSEKGGRWH